MPNLIDIPTVVGTLVTYFAMDGNDAAVEAIKGVAVNASLKLAELKDQLLCQPEVEQTVQQYQQNPLDMSLKVQLEAVLTQALQQHPAFQSQAAVHIEGGVKAKNGSIAIGVMQGGKAEVSQ